MSMTFTEAGYAARLVRRNIPGHKPVRRRHNAAGYVVTVYSRPLGRVVTLHDVEDTEWLAAEVDAHRWARGVFDPESGLYEPKIVA